MGKLILKICGSVAVLGILLVVTDTAQIVDRLRHADVVWLSVVVVCLTALTFLMARRWQLTAHALDLDLGYGRAVREYYLAQLVNLLLPGGVAGDAARAIRLRQEGDLVRAAQSVMLERLIGQAALFGMMLIGFGVVLSLPGGLEWPQWVWAFVLAGLLAPFALGIVARKSGSIAAFFQIFLRLIRQPEQLVLSTIIAILVSVGFYASAMATGTTLPLSTLFTLIPLILSAMLIPLSIGGWGWREGAAAALFPLAGALPSAGIAAGIAYGAMMLIASLPALGVLAFNPKKSLKPPIALNQVENS